MHAVKCRSFTVAVGENEAAQIVQNVSQVGLFDEKQFSSFSLQSLAVEVHMKHNRAKYLIFSQTYIN